MTFEWILTIWRRYAHVPWGRGVLALASVCAVAFALGLAVGWPAMSGSALNAPAAGGGLGNTSPTPPPTPRAAPTHTPAHAPKATTAHPARKPRAGHSTRKPTPPPPIYEPSGPYDPGSWFVSSPHGNGPRGGHGARGGGPRGEGGGHHSGGHHGGHGR